MVKHTKRVALVSGSSSQIGLAIADALAAVGFDLALSDPCPTSDCHEPLRALARNGVHVHFCQGDIASAAGRSETFDAVRSEFGRLDAFVNCAGMVADIAADVLHLAEAEFDSICDSSLKGPYLFTQLVARWMVEQRQQDASYQGTIVNVTHTRASAPLGRSTAYHISRAGFGMATQLWTHRLAEFGIAVYEVRLAGVTSDADGMAAIEHEQSLAAGAAIENWSAAPDDAGRAVAMLAAGRLTCATGNVLYVDGGRSLRRL